MSVTRPSQGGPTPGAKPGEDLRPARDHAAVGLLPAIGPPIGWPVVGRDREFAAIAAVLAGSPGSGVVISGPPGVGRTRLAREVLRTATDLGREARWAAGTRAMTAIPFGALAHLVPPVSSSTVDRLGLFQQAASAIGGGWPHPVVLVVDDAHLLDEMSAALVYQLATSGSATVVLSVRPDEGPANLAPLWRDGLATRIDVRDLDPAAAAEMAAAMLGGDLEARTAQRLWQLARGNPRLLCEVLDGERRDGRLRQSGGLWWWDGELDPSAALVDEVLTRIGAADRDQRTIVEILAAGAPITLPHLEHLGSRDAVAALERRGTVSVDGELARLAHPLYGPVVRADTPRSEARRLRRQVVEITDDLQGRVDVDGAGTLSHEDVLQITATCFEGDAPLPRDGVLTRAAERANVLLDHAAAERLARAGVRAGAGIEASLALVEALQWQGRGAEAEQLALAAAPAATTDAARVRLGVLRSVNLACGLRRPGDAEQVLRDTAVDAVYGDDRYVLAATRAFLSTLTGDYRRAVRLGRAVLHRAGPTVPAVPVASAAVATALAVTGRAEEAIAVVETGRAAQRTGDPAGSAAFANIVLAQAEVLALMLGGWANELEGRTREFHTTSMDAPRGCGDAMAALHQGWGCLATGRAWSARRWFAEATAGFDRCDPAGLRPLCVSQLAMVEALLGNPGPARRLLAELGPDPFARTTLFGPIRRVAEAWVLAAEGDRTAAGQVALDSAAIAADGGQRATEMFVLDVAARLGRAPEALVRMRELVPDVDGPLPPLALAHAEAVARDDGHALDRVGAQLEEAGLLLRAVDTVARAAGAHERSGDRRAAASSRARADTLAQNCESGAVAALAGLVRPHLTSREEQVARLAAQGLSNQTVAQRLVLSVRTVEAHLAHVYAKLGISSRRQLSRVLAPDANRPVQTDPETWT